MDLTDAMLNNVHTDMQEHYFFLFINGKIQHGKVLSFPPSSYSYEIMDIFSFVLETMLSFIIVFAC